jgi:2-oxoisovalerate dehydrogenase E2 component (dihydrolipoyl transacylase)
MNRTFRLPDLGEGLDDAEIVTWHVGPGDRVVVDQPLVSVETDKAVVEIPSPWTGTIVRVIGAPGDQLKVDAPLVEFADEPAADTGAIVGEVPAAITAAKSAAGPERRTGIAAAPAVRALARRLGVDLALVGATGVAGTITTADVERAAATPRDAYVTLPGIRRAMAQHMARAHAEVVAATVMDEAVVDHLDAAADVTVRLARAIVAGCVAAPMLNCWLDGTRLTVRRHAQVDLGIAVDTEDGLLVPVLRNVGEHSDAALRQEIDRLKRAVKERQVTPAELRGPTITLSNFGMLAGRHAALVVMPPQVAILGAGRIGTKPVVRDGQVVPARVLPLSLTFDHRAVTGGDAAQFLAAVIRALERPA